MGDFPANATTPGLVLPGSPIRGSLDYLDDTDWFATFLVAGERYTFDLFGAELGQGTLVDPYLWLRDANGTILM